MQKVQLLILVRPQNGMREGVVIVGAILLFLAGPVFADGNYKLSVLNACPTFQACPGDITPGTPDFQVKVAAAKNEVMYGLVFGSISIIILLSELIGSRKKTPIASL